MDIAADPTATFERYLQPDTTLAFPHLPLTLKAASFDTSQYCDSFFSRQQLTLPPARRNAVAKRRSEFFAGRYLAKQALQEKGSADLEVGADEKGCPLWPHGFRGSITHTNNYAACVIAQDQHLSALGIDIQDWMDEAAAEKLAPRILDQAEQRLLHQQHCSASFGVSLCFSAKESIFKALYPYIGHHFGYAAAKLQSLDRQAGTLSFAFAPLLQPPQLHCATLTLEFIERRQHVVSLLGLRR